MIFNPKKILTDKKYCEQLFYYYFKNKILVKTDDDFGKYIHKAISNLEFANFLLEEHNFSIKEKLPKKNYYDWCITIYYYSIYHVSLALLLKLGFKSKNHLATLTTITLFYYHKNNVINEKDIDFLISKVDLRECEIDFVLESKNMREKACYNADVNFNRSVTQILQEETADFVNKIKFLLDEK